MNAAARRFASGWLLAILPALAIAANAPPALVSAEYQVQRNGLTVAVMQERYEARDGAYRLTSDSQPVGVLALFQRNAARFASSGQLTRQGLRPERFEAGRGDNDARRVSADFDWAGSRLTLRHDGKTDTVELPAGAQDRLSIMYQFMHAGLEGRKEIAFAMTNGRKLDRYRYAITANVEIDTPLGRLDTLHLVKQREPGDTGTEIWLSTRHRHLPVRMLIIESDGVRYEQTITRLQVEQ